MEINIKSEKYINADAPELTEEMLDWLFLTMWSTRFENFVKKVDTIDIMANTAYNGCYNIHFYITINNKHEFHKVWRVDVPTSLQSPNLGFYFDGEHEPELGWDDKPRGRWEWVIYFVERGVDMGPEGIEAVKRRDVMIEEANRRDEIEREKKTKEFRYKQYLKLKEEFEPNK